MKRGNGRQAVLLLAVGLAACVGAVQEPELETSEPRELTEQGAPTGALRWAQQITGQAPVLGEFPPEKAGTLAKDGEDHFVVLYSFTGTLELGNRRVHSPGGPDRSAIALARYDQQGRLEWVKLFGPASGVEGGIFGRHIAVDRHRDILLSLGIEGVDLGDGELSSGELLVKLDRHGQFLWKRSLPDSVDTEVDVFDIVTDRQNRIAIGGRLRGTVDLGSGPVSSKEDPVSGGFRISPFFALLAYTRDGEERWARAFGFSGVRVGMDQKDGVVAVGTYQEGDNLGLGPLPGKGENSTSLYVAKYDRITGAPLWTRAFPAGLAEPSSLAVTKDGRSVVLGSFRSGSFIVGSEEWPQKSPNDLFLLGLDR